MTRILTALWALVFCVTMAPLASAQSDDDIVWVQIEAVSGLNTATDRARAYTTLLQDVNGFALGGVWYGIVVGPYRRADAELVLQTYRRDGVVPRDSFIQQTSALGTQFWPQGADLLNRAIVDPPAEAVPAQQTQAEAPTEEAAPQVAEDVQPDETRAEAQRSERALSRDEKKELQIALKWAGFYTAAIDGAYGRGTRRAMSDWQAANGFDDTGVLTTLQRATLLRQYNAVLEGMNLTLVQDTQAGIEMQLPLGVVAFEKYEPPFAHYAPTGDLPAKVLLISQPGDQDTLYGLYEIMQTLEIVPLEGPRQRNRNSFTLTGQNARMISHTEVALQNGEIKGFTLIWPADDEARRTRVLEKMQKSYARIDGVLSPAAGTTAEQSIDLVSGLAIRKPIRARSGFFVTRTGAVATTYDAVQNCGRITLDRDTNASVISSDAALGLAFLKPDTSLAPLGVAHLAPTPPRLQSEVALAGYSFNGVLSAPSTTFGQLADVKGLDGNTALSRLSMPSQASDAGGPVLDQTGHVMGMLVTRENSGTQLPADVSLTLDANQIASAATSAGLTLQSPLSPGALTPFQLSQSATAMTTLVNCWE